ASRAFLERRDRRQPLALEELEERAAAGRDIGDPVADLELLDRRGRVAAARDRERLARGDRLGHAPRACGELGMLEHADRAVPDDRARAAEPPLVGRGGLGADVEDHLVARDLARALHAAARARVEARADDDVGRQRYLGLAELAREQALRERYLVRLVERLADPRARGREHRVRDAAA